MATAETEETVAAHPASAAQPVAEENASAMQGESVQASLAIDAEKPVMGSTEPGPMEASLPSFKEESYFAADLTESEKMPLQEMKAKIEEAIKSSTFLPPEEEARKHAQPERAAEVAAEAAAEEVAPGEKTEGNTDEALPVEMQTMAETVAQTLETEVLAEEVSVAAEKTEEVKVSVDSEPHLSEKSAVADALTEPAQSDAVPTAEPTEALAADAGDVPVDEDLSLWGVPLLPSKGDLGTDVILLKFLRARDLKVANALTMLKNTVLWRKKFGADAILEEDLGTDFDSVAYLHGVDREGHPVSYNNFGALNDKDLYQKAFGDQASTEKFLRWRVQLLEKSIELLNFSPGGANAVIQVIDLKNSPSPAKKELRTFISQALNLLQDNYPELVVKNVLINVPWYFSALFSVISPFLTQRTKSKFILVRGAKVTEELLKLISAEQLPVHYGGLSRVNDKDFEGIEAPVTELVVKAGEKQIIEFEVPEAGRTLLWDLAVSGWDVSYGAEFNPSAQGSYTTIVEKSKKIVSQEEPLRNAFKASEAGKVVLTIDNSGSRKRKTTVFRYLVKRPEI